MQIIGKITQEEKNLLLKDLCARLPYDVKVNCNDKVYNFNGIQYFNICILTDDNENNAFTTAGIKYIKPYLFPLSSMTEEQKTFFDDKHIDIDDILGIVAIFAHVNCEEWIEIIDWLNKNHFDYRGLIPKGSAIDATGLNIY